MILFFFSHDFSLPKDSETGDEAVLDQKRTIKTKKFENNLQISTKLGAAKLIIAFSGKGQRDLSYLR